MGTLLRLYGELATKYDIKEVEEKIEETKTELLKWFIGLFVGLVIFLIGWSRTLLKIVQLQK